MLVKLTEPRTRGAREYYAGDLYPCAEEEGATLIADGQAEAAEEAVAEIIVETAVAVAPSRAVAPKPRTTKPRAKEK